MSEWITWETCPSCGARAAVGWIGDTAVEFDCASGCDVAVSRRDSAWSAPAEPDWSPAQHHRHVVLWSRRLCAESKCLRQEAVSACEVCRASVAATRQARAARAALRLESPAESAHREALGRA